MAAARCDRSVCGRLNRSMQDQGKLQSNCCLVTNLQNNRDGQIIESTDGRGPKHEAMRWIQYIIMHRWER